MSDPNRSPEPDPTPTSPPEPELLPFDDDSLPPAPPPGQGRRWWIIPLSFVLSAFAVTAVLVVYYALDAQAIDMNWGDYEPLGGDCTLLMPGPATETELDLAGRPTIRDGKMYRLDRVVGFKKIRLDIGWYDLDSDALGFTDLESLAIREREALLREHPGEVVREGIVKLDLYDARQVIIQTEEQGVWARRVILEPERPRVYVMTIGGTALEQDSPAIGKYFDSLKIQEP